MKRYNSILAIATVLTVIMGLMIPANLVTTKTASAANMEWTPVNTPDITRSTIDNVFTPVPGFGEDEMGSEIIKLAVANNGQIMYALVRVGYYGGYDGQFPPFEVSDVGNVILMQSFDGGVHWMWVPQVNLERDYHEGAPAPVTVYDFAIAPDNPMTVIVAVADKPNEDSFSMEQEVWISTDGGTFWQDTNWPGDTGMVPGEDFISAMDISMDFGQGRYILVGTRDGTGAGDDNIQTMRVPGYGGWAEQDDNNVFTGDVITAKFSPTFIGDSTIAVVYADNASTNLVTGAMDIFANVVEWSPYPVELKNAGSPPGASPDFDEIWVADLEMPSDFSGQTASLRRFYVSTAAAAEAGLNHGIYRVDDNVVYTLMDNTNIDFKAIYSIAYWGTYASGKLMGGEIFGYACTATVPTWFTDSPTVCPVPCWYPAKKPVTGAAGQEDCEACTRGWGNAWVVWSPTYADQGVAYAVTGSENWGPFAAPDIDPPADVVDPPANVELDCDVDLSDDGQWPAGILAVPVPLDESAFALTRNNGATWNELALIDTRIAKLTDVAVSPDCTTIYLASVNNETACRGFDSVWRSSSNEKVVAPPLPALPAGTIWERVLTHVTAITCEDCQSDYAILRLAQDKLDGQVVFWAAGGTSGLAAIWSGCDEDVIFPLGSCPPDTEAPGNWDTRAVEWSPDFGDFWGDIRPRLTVQDMAAPTSTVLYVVDFGASVQKLPYTGTAWSSASATVAAKLQGAHTIEAVGANDAIVAGNLFSSWVASYSSDAGLNFFPFSWSPPTTPVVGYHVIFDTDFATTKVVFSGDDGATGAINRNKVDTMGIPWTNMMRICGGHNVGYFGLAQSNSKNVSQQGTLYGAHRPIDGCEGPICWSGVERTLRPLDGIPKPCVEWSCLDASTGPYRVDCEWFTLEPKSLKLCGCLTQDTNTTLYAIDNDWYASNHNLFMSGPEVTDDDPPEVIPHFGGILALGDRGRLWAYTDCVAKVGPTLTMDDNTIIGCDPATGRNQEVNFTWEQLCIATAYELHIDKAKAMNLPVFTGFVVPYDVTSPSLVYLSGGEGIGGATAYAELNDVFGDGFLFSEQILNAVPSLECGHTYYWKVRVINEVTDDLVDSPWSEIRGFTIKAGFRVTTPYYGPQLLAPDNGCGCACAAPVCFSWSPFKETTAYKFELSENADMSSPIVSTEVKGATAYQWTGTPKCNTNYFWRVMATTPAPSEWSATFSFMTQPAPPAPTTPPAEKEPVTPLWVWVIIAIGAILVIVTLVLIFKTRRV